VSEVTTGMEEAFEQKLHEMRQRFADILHTYCALENEDDMEASNVLKNIATETSSIEGMGSNGAACVVINLREDGAFEVDANTNDDADSASGEAAPPSSEGDAPGTYLSLLSPTLSPIDVFP